MVGKIGLVGAGAVGSYYGLVLQKAGEDVHFCSGAIIYR